MRQYNQNNYFIYISGLHQKETEVVVQDIGQQVDPTLQPVLEHRLTHPLLNSPVIR